MQHLIDPETLVGYFGTVIPRTDDPFVNEFVGKCVGIRNGFLQVKDQDDDIYEIEMSQFVPDTWKLE